MAAAASGRLEFRVRPDRKSIIERLDVERHDLSGFSCGEPSPDSPGAHSN